MSNTYKSRDEERADKVAMERLLSALDASPKALRVDDCGAWTIFGKHGTIRTYGPDEDDGFQILVGHETSKAQTYAERRIAFCKRPPIGNGLLLDHLPTPEEAEAIRTAVGIKKCKRFSEEELDRRSLRLRGPREPHIDGTNAWLERQVRGWHVPLYLPAHEGDFWSFFQAF